MNREEEIRNKIKAYEERIFFKEDPVSFLWKYKEKKDIEIAAVICSVLAFGSRKQIYKACEKTLALMGDSPYEYIMSPKWGEYKDNSTCWYRMLKWCDFYSICHHLCYTYTCYPDLEDVIAFNVHCGDSPVEAVIDTLGYLNGFPKDKKSCCKRVNLMLRWLVRQNSPVDVGIWRLISASQLLVPCDVHVLRKARELGFITRKSDDMKSCMQLTNKCREIVPDDPSSVDYALFGMGYEEKHPEIVEKDGQPTMKMTPNMIVLVSTYQCMALNELACCCVLDIELSVKDKDKETKKLYYAAKKRVDKYQKDMNKITLETGTLYSDFNDHLDEYVQPLLRKYREAIENYITNIKGVEFPYFCSLVEVARSMTKFSITETHERIIECNRHIKDASGLAYYKQKELLDILTNLTKWIFRKADDINYNNSPDCVKAYVDLIDCLVNPDILAESIIFAKQLNEE